MKATESPGILIGLLAASGLWLWSQEAIILIRKITEAPNIPLFYGIGMMIVGVLCVRTKNPITSVVGYWAFAIALMCIIPGVDPFPFDFNPRPEDWGFEKQ